MSVPNMQLLAYSQGQWPSHESPKVPGEQSIPRGLWFFCDRIDGLCLDSPSSVVVVILTLVPSRSSFLGRAQGIRAVDLGMLNLAAQIGRPSHRCIGQEARHQQTTECQAVGELTPKTQAQEG
ncbi:MAG: hypothetical protein ACOVS5_15440, partial [Oligoflexus sp.]